MVPTRRRQHKMVIVAVIQQQRPQMPHEHKTNVITWILIENEHPTIEGVRREKNFLINFHPHIRTAAYKKGSGAEII